MSRLNEVQRKALSVSSCGLCYMYVIPEHGSLLRHIPQLDYCQVALSIFDLKVFANDKSKGLSLPDEVNAGLYTLLQAINSAQLSKDVETEKTRVKNALIELRGTLEAYHAHDLPEPKLLIELLNTLLKVTRRLEDPGQSSSRSY